jgi:hypothetical protein
MLCKYGCGSDAKFTLKNGTHCCSAHSSSCSALKEKNSAINTVSYQDGRKPYVYADLPQTTKDKMAWSRGKIKTTNAEVFVKNSRHSNEMVKQRIVSDNLLGAYECSKCGLDGMWQGETIVLDLDHINGDNTDNRLLNLRYLCPNCHSQTDTFKGRNNTGKTKVSDKELLTALNECANIRQALISVGLAAKGGNYERAKRLLK